MKRLAPFGSVRARILSPRTHFRYAASYGPSETFDPSFNRANELVAEGSKALEDGDLSAASSKYRESLHIRETSKGWFNLGVR
jgi:hypothetical protein